MSVLFNGDDSDSELELKVNSNYANNYDNWRRKEELNKLKTKYGEDVTDDSSSSDEDENLEDPKFDREFYKALACLKKKDPRIYDENTLFFNDIDKSETTKDCKTQKKEKKIKEKPLVLRDYERKILMERDGQFSSSEDENDRMEKSKIKTQTYVEEQQELKDNFKHVLKNDSEDTDEDTDLLKIKQKTENEKHKEEESYKEWLKGQKSEIDAQEQEELMPLRDFWSDPNLDESEKFLRDYILNSRYKDKESSDIKQDYDQIAHDSDKDLSEDEKNIEEQEEFEHKYNFRFEEPDQEFIKRYPRTMEDSMRKKDTRRAQKRNAVKQRKEEEKQQKREELKQLKVLKRKEIEEKIAKLKEITGNDDMCFDNVDFDSDFNPNEHDKRMQELFNDEYYANTQDEMKPEFPDIDEELDIESMWDNYDPTTGAGDIEDAPAEETHCEDPDFNMDADYNESQNLQTELIENSKKRKRKKRSKFAMLIAKTKPKFDPKQFPSYEEYFDQYYSLDYEDMIGDLPCRFKYRKVTPNDYGLNVEEILMADDKELNKWCSLKKALQYKPEHVEMREVQIYKQKATNEAFKQKILRSLYTNLEEKEKETHESELMANDDIKNKKRRRQNKKNKVNDFNINSNTDAISNEENGDIAENSTQHNSYNSKSEESQSDNIRETDAGVKEEKKINESRKRKNNLTIDSNVTNLKKIKTNNIKEESNNIKDDSQIKVDNSNLEKDKKKKKKKKQSQFHKTKNTNEHKPQNNESFMMSLNTERLKTYGIKPKKFKNKLKYGGK